MTRTKWNSDLPLSATGYEGRERKQYSSGKAVKSPSSTAGKAGRLRAGITATFADFATVVTGKLPWFILATVGLSFLLLVVAFRSLLIPATAAVMNLLAAAASFGVLVAFFQWGWDTDALGLGRAGPVEAFLPPVTLAILFGLSMDYQVFLVSRMNEEWVHGRNSRRAVRTGQTQTARVITAAATIMICVFLTFSFMGQRDIAEASAACAATHRSAGAVLSAARFAC